MSQTQTHRSNGLETDQICKTIVGLLHASKANAPISLNFLKDMHSGLVGNGMFYATRYGSLSVPPMALLQDSGYKSDEIILFNDYLQKLGTHLAKINLELRPIWDGMPTRVDENQNRFGALEFYFKSNLHGFYLKNIISDQRGESSNFENHLEDMLKITKPETTANKKKIEEALDQVDLELDILKDCYLIGSEDTPIDKS